VKYQSSALMQNIISNTSFEPTSGWTGTHINGTSKAAVENVYGYFDHGTFVNSIDQLNAGNFDPTKNTYKAYLKVTFPDTNSCLINSGPYDNRTLIGKFEDKEQWALNSTIYDSTGRPSANLIFSLGEYKYNPATDGYTKYNDNLTFSNFEASEDGTYLLTEATSSYNEKDFKKKMQCRLSI
jgi:hypothetical protein